MSTPLKVGLVGFGAVAQVHMEAYRDLSAIRVVAVADVAPMRRQLAQQQYGLRAHVSLENMLSSESLDIACVLTPTASHERCTLESARARVHVLCEKPLALSVESCERMIAGCRANGVQLCYGASYRYLPALIRAREMILAGDIGDVLLLREHAIGGTGPDNRDTLSFAHYPPGSPGGSGMGLVDHGIHLIDTFAWLMNTRTQRVHGRGNISGQPQRPEYAHLEYENGALGQLTYEDGTYPTDLPHEGAFSWGGGWDVNGRVPAGSWNAQPGCIHVHGTRGALRILYYANKLYHRNGEGIRQVRVDDAPMPANFSAQMLAFAAAIRAQTTGPVPGEVGAEAVRALLQIYASAPGAPASKAVG